MATLRAEATFSWYEMASKKQPLPKTIQISIVHAQNSSRDSQATGSSSLCEFRGNQNCENYLRTTLLELSFCFSALPPLVLSILAEKHFLGSSFLEKYYYVTNFSKSCLLSGELNSNWQFFWIIIGVITLMLKKFFSQSKRSYYDLLARVKPS